MIEVSHIIKDYGTRRAVDDLSFTLEKGKIYGFLGPNGAGKSTTMNIMTGYLAPTSGNVNVNGADMLAAPMEAKSHIGYLPEIPPVFPDLTVSEYLTYTAELKHIPPRRIRDAKAKVLHMTGTGGQSARLIKNLSKGYRQRVGMAGALIGLPEIIILDEPTVGLDPAQIIEVRSMISSLRKTHTVVLSSHILSEISSVCDEIIIIAGGKKLVQGTLQEVEEKYSRKNQLLLRLKEGSTDYKALLENIPGVQQVTKEQELSVPEEKGTMLFRIYMQEPCLTREKIAYTLLQNSIPVLEMYADRTSLEDVFLRVTSSRTDEEGAL